MKVVFNIHQDGLGEAISLVLITFFKTLLNVQVLKELPILANRNMNYSQSSVSSGKRLTYDV